MGQYNAEDLKKWQEQMLAMPATQRVGQQDPMAVINSGKPDVKTALTPTATTPPTSLTPASMSPAQQQFDQDILNKRKGLASTLKQFARDEVRVDPNQMIKDASTIGVSREQLSGLYKQYRNEFNKEKADQQLTNQQFSGLARYKEFQNKPIGSSPMGATGVQGAVGGLARGYSPTRGTPLGTQTSRTQVAGGFSKGLQNIAALNLAKAEQNRLLQNEQLAMDKAEQLARINAFITANKPIEEQPVNQMPFYNVKK